MLLVLSLAWRHAQDLLAAIPRSDFLRVLLLVASTGMCVVTQLWNPSGEASYGFVIAPLVLSVVFRTIGSSVGANIFIVGAWAIAWNFSGLTFTSHALLTHLLYVPTLSIAISLTQQGALRELVAFHANQVDHIEERHHAMRMVEEEASLRAKSEAELQRKNAMLELILATVPDEIFVKDCQRKILVANHAYLDYLNVELEDVLGQSTDNLIPKNLVDDSIETDMAVLRKGQHLRGEFVAIHDDGTEKTYELDKLPLLEDGKIMGILGVNRDITERRTAEERIKEQETLLLHASRLSSMGELVAGIAHEINQPLYSILNYAKAVKNTLHGPREPSLDDIGDWIDQILKEATRGGEITKRLRSFVRRSETHREQTSLSTIVQESIALIVGEARSSGVEIQCDLQDSLPKVVVDRVQIQQVLINLIKNAIEALRDHDGATRRIAISARLVPAGVEVTVADNGPGIPTDRLTDITEPFFTTKSEGVGLGLAISKTIIEAHQSELLYTTNDWGGATFQFFLGKV